ncbi:hypothetical protein SASPL_135705 [Salvia splendens]|uniref:Uncharacterized protein n=1 Tax=Salvia splendens TaxID=180675 RepID=A0A8X8ZFQ7_SALSN|nr:hypothetical protein SASPL_135705 [Salvia splendens]
MGVLAKLKRQQKQDSQNKSVFLKIVRPGGQVELFLDPIPAGEIMRRYPRYCITRPDFFDSPWIVVRPDSVLKPGEAFFLVPHYTVDKVMKDNMHRFQQSSESPLPPPAEPTPRVREGAPVGQRQNHTRSTTDHRHHHHDDRRSNQDQDRNHKRQTAHDQNHNKNITSDQDSEQGGLYKEMFYETWEEMRRQLHEKEDSTLTRDEVVVAQRALPCLRKGGRGKRKLHKKVRFSSPIIISGSQRGTPVH